MAKSKKPASGELRRNGRETLSDSSKSVSRKSKKTSVADSSPPAVPRKREKPPKSAKIGVKSVSEGSASVAETRKKKKKPQQQQRTLREFEIDGCRVLPWKFSEDSNHVFHLLFKEHLVRKTCDAKPLGKTLLVSEVPPSIDERTLRNIFCEFGDVRDVFLQLKPSPGAPFRATSDLYPVAECSPALGYRVAYVVFGESEAVKTALAKTFSCPVVLQRDDAEDDDSSTVFGLAKYARNYNRGIPDEDELLLEATKFLHNYESEEKTRREEEKRLSEPDEAGWVTVGSRGTKRGGFSRSEAMQQKVGAEEKRKKAKKELVNFYTFQVRESKMKHIEELQKRFEQDKRRLELIKQNRKFKPY